MRVFLDDGTLHTGYKEIDVHSRISLSQHVTGIQCSQCKGRLIMYSARVKYRESDAKAYAEKYGNVWKIMSGKTYPNCIGYNPDKHCPHCGCEFLKGDINNG